MYKITWDKETGGVQLHSRIVEGTLGISPRPVCWEELDLLKLNELGWAYPHSEEPLLAGTGEDDAKTGECEKDAGEEPRLHVPFGERGHRVYP